MASRSPRSCRANRSSVRRGRGCRLLELQAGLLHLERGDGLIERPDRGRPLEPIGLSAASAARRAIRRGSRGRCAHRSDRRATARDWRSPVSALGRRHWSAPADPSRSASSSLATPKSSSRTCPDSVTRMFEGLRSRWMTLFHGRTARPRAPAEKALGARVSRASVRRTSPSAARPCTYSIAR